MVTKSGGRDALDSIAKLSNWLLVAKAKTDAITTSERYKHENRFVISGIAKPNLVGWRGVAGGMYVSVSIQLVHPNG